MMAERCRDLLEFLDGQGRGSTIVTSQIVINHRYAMIANPHVAVAILDRLVHNTYRSNLAGESLRRQTHVARRVSLGVTLCARRWAGESHMV